MAVLKWIVVVVLGLAGLGAFAFGLMAAAPLREGRKAVSTAPRVSLRTFPGSPAAVAPEKTPPKTPAADAGAAVRAPDAGKTVAVDAGRPAVPDAGHLAAPDAGKPDAGRPPVSDAGVVRVAPPPPPPPQPKGGGEAILNLRASDTADVFLDGKKIGASPLMGLKLKAGQHKVRFDCYDAAGNTTPGQVQPITLVAEENKIVEFTCPASE